MSADGFVVSKAGPPWGKPGFRVSPECEEYQKGGKQHE